MAKGQKENIQNKMLSLGDKLAKKEPDTPMQHEVKIIEKKEVIQQKTEKQSEKAFHLFIPESMYWEAKAESLKERISMKDYINRAIAESIEKRNKK